MSNKAEQDAALFLKELGKGIPEHERVMAGYAEEATVQTDASGKKLNGGWWPVPYKDGKYINTSGNCYACISSSIKTPNPKTGKERYWRGEASFGHGLALMVDDIGHGKGSKGGLDIDHFQSILPPTAIVETSPNNFQLWYFFETPEPDMHRFKAFLSCFVAQVLQKGGDNTIKDISRYGRMPCGVNNKRHDMSGPYKYPVIEDGRTKPFRVRLVGAQYHIRYTMDEIASAFGFEIVVPVRREIEINEEEYKYDAIWLRMAERILGAAKLGEGSGGDVVLNMSGKYRIRCPWGDNHANGDPYGAYFRGPIPGAEVEFVFGCGHDSCRKVNKRTWAAFVDAVVMPKIEAELEAINKRNI